MRGIAVHRILGVRFQTTVSSMNSAEASLTKNLPPLTEETPIKIPMRIKRGPTDILKALAATVGRDETAAHYKYHDDPYLIPSNSFNRRRFAMCKEAGRKAALYFATKFPNLFMYDQDEPRIDNFRPQGRPNLGKNFPEEKLNEKTLFEFLEKGWTTESIKLFEILKEKQTKNAKFSISKEIKYKFLEFLCFHNSQEPIESEFHEQNFHRSYYALDQQLKSQWNSTGPAMTLFEEMEPKDLRVYTAIIRGMVKYSAFDDAYEMYQKMLESKISPNLHIYNAILECAFEVKLKPDEVWKFVIEILNEMAQRKIKPNLHTFNAILAQLDRCIYWNKCSEKCLEVLREMKELEIEPSLATYYYFLHINEKKDQLGSYVDFVLTAIENKNMQIRDKNDNQFYQYCISIIARNIQDKNFAYRLHANLLYANNHVFLNDVQHEINYYDHLISVLSRYEETAKFLDFFDGLVPHIATPSIFVIQEIIENIDVDGAQHMLPRIYPSLVAGLYLKSGPIVAKFVNAMYHASDSVDFDTRRKFADIAFDIKEKVDLYIYDANYYKWDKTFSWTPLLLSRLAKLCEKGGQIERSEQIAKSGAELLKANQRQGL